MGFGNRGRPSNSDRQEYDNTNRWVLFENNRKRNAKDADYNGTINIDGREYWLNGWESNGKAVASGTVKPKQEQRRDQYEQSREYQRPAARDQGYDRDPSPRGRDEDVPRWEPDAGREY